MADTNLQAVLGTAVGQASTRHGTVQLQTQVVAIFVFVFQVSVSTVQRSALGQVMHIAQRQLVGFQGVAIIACAVVVVRSTHFTSSTNGSGHTQTKGLEFSAIASCAYTVVFEFAFFIETQQASNTKVVPTAQLPACLINGEGRTVIGIAIDAINTKPRLRGPLSYVAPRPM